MLANGPACVSHTNVKFGSLILVEVKAFSELHVSRT